MKQFSFPFFAILMLLAATTVSCKKEQATDDQEDLLTDIDGNRYDSVRIGSQVWMKQNLKTSKYRDGSAIATGLTNDQWKTTTSGAYAYSENNESNNALHGKIYNGHAALDTRKICPEGWHIPTQAEWELLFTYLGGMNNAGGAMKATIGWTPTNVGATNSSGFTAYGAAGRDGNFGDFSTNGTGTLFWTSTVSGGSIIAYGLQNRYGSAYISSFTPAYGVHCRCVLD